jgi:hypothetical protein
MKPRLHLPNRPVPSVQQLERTMKRLQGARTRNPVPFMSGSISATEKRRNPEVTPENGPQKEKRL